MYQSPLQCKGDSEDGGSESSNHPAVEEPPFAAPKEATPLKAVPTSLDLEFSTTVESDDKVGDEEVNIIVDSPRHSPAPCEASAYGKDAEKQNMASSSGMKGSGGEESSTTSDSSSFFIRNADPEAAAWSLERSPRLCVLAATSSSPFVLRAGIVSVNCCWRRVARFVSH